MQSTPSMLLPSRSLSSALKANEALSMSVTPHLEVQSLSLHGLLVYYI